MKLMRNIYQEQTFRNRGMSREELDDYGDYIYTMSKENAEEERFDELERADKLAAQMDHFYDCLREPKQ